MRFVRTVGVLFTLAATPAFGAGYEVKEHSAEAMASAYAGSAATGTDAGYLAYNPAAAASVENFDFSASATQIFPGSSANYSAATTSAGNSTGGSLHPNGYVRRATVPAVAARLRLGPRWAIGLTVNAPWGLKTDYPTTWAGRYYALKTELLTINATPVISYQVTRNFAIAAGPQIEYAQGTLTSAIDTGTIGAGVGVPGSIPGAQDSFAKVSGKNWSYGYTFGAIYHPDNAWSIGASYRSSIDHDLRGAMKYQLDGAGIGATINALTGLFANTRGGVDVTVPQTASLGIRDDISSRWSGLLEVDWTGWSAVHELRVTSQNPAQPADITLTHWHNTIFGALGAEYRADRHWTLRGGVAFDESPTPDATREPRIPDVDRYWISAGVSYLWTDSTALTLAASHLFDATKDIALNPLQTGNTYRGSLSGVTKSDVNVVALQATFRAN